VVRRLLLMSAAAAQSFRAAERWHGSKAALATAALALPRQTPHRVSAAAAASPRE